MLMYSRSIGYNEDHSGASNSCDAALGKSAHASGFVVSELHCFSADDRGIYPTGPDAAIRLACVRAPATGAYEITVCFAAPQCTNANFLVEYQVDGVPRRRMLHLAHLGSARYQGVVDVPASLSALIIRPNAPGIHFQVRELVFRPLGKLSRAALLFRRAFTILRRDPAQLISSFYRYRTSRARGDAVSFRSVSGGEATYENWVTRHDDDPTRDEPLYRERLASSHGHLASFSILLPIMDGEPAALQETLQGVVAQFHGDWELLLILGPLSPEPLRQLALASVRREKRFRIINLTRQGNVAAHLNSGLAEAKMGWLVVLEIGELLRPHALAELSFATALKKKLRFLYSDEDRIDLSGKRHSPQFKPEWSPDLLRSWNYVGRLCAWHTHLLRNLHGWREDYDEGFAHDLSLRVGEALCASQIGRLPKLLIHTCEDARPGKLLDTTSLKAVADHLKRSGQPAEVRKMPTGVVRVNYGLPSPPPLVSIIIPTRDRVDLLNLSVGSILEKTSYPQFEIIIVDNNSTDSATTKYLTNIGGHQRVRVLGYPHPFNYSAINNFAVGHARGELLAFVNNDIEVIAPDWLDEMAGHANRTEIGCVGAKLYYPNDLLQHAGIVLGLGGIAGHAHKLLPRSESGYLLRAISACNVSAVTAACLVVRRSIYDEVMGLDEVGLAVAFNDVDFCLRVRARGYLNLWTPFAELYHYESLSRGSESTPAKAERFAKETDVMMSRWEGELTRDPYYSPHLTRLREDYSIRD